LSYLSCCPNDARGQAFRTLLGTESTTPFCPSPFRGYQTAITDDVSRHEAGSRNPGGWSAALPTDRSHAHSHSSTLTSRPFAGTTAGGDPWRGPQHSPSVLGSGLRDQPLRNADWHDESRLAWGSPSCEEAAGMGARPFHDVAAA